MADFRQVTRPAGLRAQAFTGFSPYRQLASQYSVRGLRPEILAQTRAQALRPTMAALRMRGRTGGFQEMLQRRMLQQQMQQMKGERQLAFVQQLGGLGADISELQGLRPQPRRELGVSPMLAGMSSADFDVLRRMLLGQQLSGAVARGGRIRPQAYQQYVGATPSLYGVR